MMIDKNIQVWFLTIILLAGLVSAATTTISGTDGGYDTWNTASNWDNSVPAGTIDVEIAPGVKATVDNAATTTYTGSLTLNINSQLQIGWNTNTPENANVLGTNTITLNDGSEIISRGGFGNYTMNQHIHLAGNGKLWPGRSTVNHHTTKTLAGGISGPGKLTWSGVNNTTGIIKTANPDWSGGFEIVAGQNQDNQFKVTANGAFGTGDIKVENLCSLEIISGLGNAIDDTATITINGLKSNRVNGKLILNSDETVGGLIVDGQQMPYSTYDNSEEWITGNGILTVVNPDQTAPDVNAGVDMVAWSGRQVQLNPEVTNNSSPPATLVYKWTTNAPAGYSVVFVPSDEVDAPGVTITKDADTGNATVIELTLAVRKEGGIADVIDIMTIDLYDDACQAAVGIGHSSIDPGDFNEDCKTNLTDFVMIADRWLASYEINEPTLKF